DPPGRHSARNRTAATLEFEQRSALAHCAKVLTVRGAKKATGTADAPVPTDTLMPAPTRVPELPFGNAPPQISDSATPATDLANPKRVRRTTLPGTSSESGSAAVSIGSSACTTDCLRLVTSCGAESCKISVTLRSLKELSRTLPTGRVA